MAEYGRRIRELREEAGISMKKLGEAIGVSGTAVCKWENMTAEPKLSYLYKMAEFFNCSCDYLIGRADDFGGIAPEANSLTRQEKNLLADFRALAEENKTFLCATAALWKKQNKNAPPA